MVFSVCGGKKDNMEQASTSIIAELKVQDIIAVLSTLHLAKDNLPRKITGTESIYRLRCHQSVIYD